jgi:hypothetical protein
VRLESFRRGWDYSLGIIMDDIHCYTIDEYEQKTFYHRSFSKKETNEPFNKILNINTFEIYHNDDEKVFMCNELEHGHGFLLRMMAYPFAKKESKMVVVKSSKKKMAEEMR